MRVNKTNLSVIDNTGARIQPRIIIGDNAGYKSGDILDANAVLKEIDKINKADTNDYLDKVEEFSTFLADIDNTKTLGELLGALDSRLLALEEVGGSPSIIYSLDYIRNHPQNIIDDILNGVIVYLDMYEDLTKDEDDYYRITRNLPVLLVHSVDGLDKSVDTWKIVAIRVVEDGVQQITLLMV